MVNTTGRCALLTSPHLRPVLLRTILRESAGIEMHGRVTESSIAPIRNPNRAMKTLFAHSRLAVAAVCLFSLSACVVDGPPGPTVPVMPGDNKTLGQFQQDDATCRGFASQQTGI